MKNIQFGSSNFTNSIQTFTFYSNKLHADIRKIRKIRVPPN